MSMHRKPEQSSQSFLPEDYLQQKADRRMGVITLVLFCVVMFGVVGAFFVTNRQWSEVKREQESINREYAAEAKKIEQLKVLEAQKAEMLDKAEITTALIEKVPRSILLAELINRMPKQLTLTEFALTSKRIQVKPSSALPRTPPKPRSLSGGPSASPARPAERPKPTPPKYEFKLELVGLAASDSEVADYQAALQNCELLEKVDLLFSGEVTVNDVGMRKFRIEAMIRPGADARHIEPLQVPRLAGLPNSSSTTIDKEKAAEHAAEVEAQNKKDLAGVSPRQE